MLHVNSPYSSTAGSAQVSAESTQMSSGSTQASSESTQVSAGSAQIAASMAEGEASTGDTIQPISTPRTSPPSVETQPSDL